MSTPSSPVLPLEAHAPDPLFRVARSDRLLDFSYIDAADAAMARSGNRFDVPGGGVLYLASTPAGCYAETLARYRPSARIIEAVRDEDPSFLVAGAVPADWRHRRLLVEVDLHEPLSFIDIEAAATHTFLTGQLAAELTTLGINELDVAAVRGPNRLVTRLVAGWAYTASDEQGDPLYAGIRYVSRLGNHECWAVFDGTGVTQRRARTIDQNNPDLLRVAADFGLRIF
ncbi:RES domain-containing protein [Antricoccus suffuscus]|uniref:RES domain-containing protein n=1 Tax=Antricoccus suffuscus TaxID=1629062 RepID=A0A2T0ZEL5_9ACTN|nr:RES family NAD+ phosphorylase [Antricoccus suffuscus]PRZ34799.1 RES domain-containing protein [Antricoccus suffuscus]